MPWIVCCRKQDFRNSEGKEAQDFVKRKARSEALLSELLSRQQGDTDDGTKCDTTSQVQHFLSSLGISSDAACWEKTLRSEWSDDAEEATPEGCQSRASATNRCREDLGGPSVKYGVEH